MKKWYNSKTMWLQILQKVQLATGAVTASAFPNLAPQAVAGMVIAGILLAIIQIVVRTMPTHGDSLTLKQHEERESSK